MEEVVPQKCEKNMAIGCVSEMRRRW